MLGAGVSLRDVQIAARHADPRTTMRYDRARKNLDRHPNYISLRTWPPARSRRSRLCRRPCAPADPGVVRVRGQHEATADIRETADHARFSSCMSPVRTIQSTQ